MSDDIPGFEDGRPICTDCSEPFAFEPYEPDYVEGGEYYSACDCEASNDLVISKG